MVSENTSVSKNATLAIPPVAATIGKLPEALKVSEIFSVAKTLADREPERLITYNMGVYSYHAYVGGLTLVMCRDIRKSVIVATAVALRTALKFPDRKVLLFNTYAGAELLTEGFVQALNLLGFKVPFIYQRYIRNGNLGDFSDAVELPSPENLHVLDVPTSMLTPDVIKREVEKYSADIVLLNSFEFAAFADYRRKEIAEALLDIRHRLSASVLVFSNQLRIIAPYTGGRGALGLLSAFASSVWHVVHEWEQHTWVNKIAEMQERKIMEGVTAPTEGGFSGRHAEEEE